MSYYSKDRAELLKIVKKQQEMIKNLQHHMELDYLTGIYSRKTGLLKIRKLLQKSEVKVTIVFIDIDNFKDINDSYGHRSGDEILKYVVHLIKSKLRREDLLFRYGGDELVAVFKDLSYRKCEAIISRINCYVKEKTEKVYGIPISFSFGVKTFENLDYCCLESAIDIADKRMYMSKVENKKRGKANGRKANI